MRINKIIKYAILSLTLVSSVYVYAEPKVDVIPSSTEIGLDENLSLEFKASVDDYKGEIGAPEFSAPDFDEVNIYAGMTGIESSIVNGSIFVKRTKSVTVVLHPKRTGKLEIKNIQMKINGNPVKSDNLTISVSALSDPSKRRGQYGYGNQKSPLPGSGVKPQRMGGSFFVKTEPSKMKVYKGEQIILTYALYTGVPILGIYAERYPTLPGFLKEDMDIAILGGRLQFSKSVVGGKEYNRAPLAQYAIFPLKDGKLSIDPLVAKYTYRHPGRQQVNDDDDPFGMLNNFLGSMQSTTDSRSSDRVSIEVLPLPAAGQPKSFLGLVGDFDITVMVDKYSVKAGEPINVKVKVEGKGHAGSLEHLNVEWPKDFEQYEDKSSTTFQKTGRSERIFDFMLIPRAKGEYEIPAIELSMFNPDTEKYMTRKSQPIKVSVVEGIPGMTQAPSSSGISAKASNQKEEVKQDIRYLIEAKPTGVIEKSKSILIILMTASFVLLAFVLVRKSGMKIVLPKKKDTSNTYKGYLDRAGALKRIDHAPSEVLSKAEDIVADILLNRYGISVGSLTRSEIKESLKSKVSNQIVIDSCESLLERCENLRFAPGQAKSDLARKVVEDLTLFIERIFQ